MMEILDTITNIFWSTTYLLIVIYSWHDKKMRMPHIVGAICFAWELNALIYSPHWGHIPWLTLDCIILGLNLCGIVQRKGRIYSYVSFLFVALLSLYVVFRIPAFNGMLISSFILDLAIAVEYLLRVKQIDVRGKIPIATTKLVGDIFAWITYGKEMTCIVIIGAVVFVLNLFYLCCCLEEKANVNKKKFVNRKERGRR